MSNNQWTGAQDWNAQPQQPNGQEWNAQPAQDWNAQTQQPAAPEWGQPAQDQTTIQPAAQDWGAQSQPSGQEWGTQQPVQDWGQPAAQEQTNIQPAAQDWGAQSQPSGQDWGVSSQPSGQDWGAQPVGQENTGIQDWGNPQQAAWGAAPQQQQWGGQPQGQYGGQQQWAPQQPASGLGALFDFGFKGSMLRSGLGTVYLVVFICFGVFGLFELIRGLTLSINAGQTLVAIIVPLAISFIGIVLTRAFLEGMAALVKKSDEDSE
ncbi:MAG: DUF4282 domain-containing protein [Propionibacteriaceae bacterium]|nr:DUF4282 domain-containing protein [Propionibacteriaceae bacterium]